MKKCISLVFLVLATTAFASNNTIISDSCTYEYNGNSYWSIDADFNNKDELKLQREVKEILQKKGYETSAQNEKADFSFNISSWCLPQHASVPCDLTDKLKFNISFTEMESNKEFSQDSKVYTLLTRPLWKAQIANRVKKLARRLPECKTQFEAEYPKMKEVANERVTVSDTPCEVQNLSLDGSPVDLVFRMIDHHELGGAKFKSIFRNQLDGSNSDILTSDRVIQRKNCNKINGCGFEEFVRLSAHTTTNNYFDKGSEVTIKKYYNRGKYGEAEITGNISGIKKTFYSTCRVNSIVH